MTYAQNVWLYSILLFGIIIVPGMDMFFVIANSLTGGRLRGFAATAGIMLGGICHTLFGTIGVSAIVKSSPQILTGILLAGAGYMMWIGYTLLRSSITVGGIGPAATGSLWSAFRQGLVTCLLNPKAYLFVVAVYPQFMRPEYGPIWRQALVMGGLTFIMQFAVYGGLGLAAAGSRQFLTGSPAVTVWIGKAAGAVFVVAAVLTLANGLDLV
jgi:threonine/homoserine/homoserine lactone efflux protein